MDDISFIEKVRNQIRKDLWDGVKQGWWDSVDEDRLEPIKYIRLKLSDGPTMAHAFVKAGIFKSVGEGRRNGWNKPIEKGTFKVGKKHATVLIED